MKLLGVDYGEARTGLAYSDALGLYAVGMGNIKSYNIEKAAVDIAAKAKEIGALIANNPLGINKFAETAPVLVAVVEEPAVLMAKAQGTVPNDRWAKFDLGSATEHFCLQAAELGLGTCIMGAFDSEAINTALDLPKDRNVFIMLAVGYPSGNTRTKVRKEVDKICSFNRYEG